MPGSPVLPTLRDQLLEAEQARQKLTIRTVACTHEGIVSDVGVDYVTLTTNDGTVDCALFHITSVVW